MKGKYIVPKAPKKVQGEAQEALTAALDQAPDIIHFDQRGKRTTATLYVGNLEFKTSIHQGLEGGTRQGIPQDSR
jgi:hypothetical protein